jgi:alanyl-tRNA synthetase
MLLTIVNGKKSIKNQCFQMKINEIRQQFFHFFASKNHLVVPSAPMVLKNDPSLMFTNAGMNQFKDLFLGNAAAKDLRVADTQKCLRVSGKHNDLEEVGVDTYHHTMFEMLGNWSFGDYFKQEAIEWAWELLTEVYAIDTTRIYVTVFEGDNEDGTAFDYEAFEIWNRFVDKDRIINGNKKDNFWEMGDTGPCGPCSEIHVDIRSDEERKKIPGKDLVNKDHPQVIEIWNLVFMQFNRMANGSLAELPAKHVDTGMGLERLAMVLQKKTSNYDTDLFQALIQEIVKVSGVQYGASEKTDIALRVIADHVRAISFSIADGQLPSNTGAGYVIRRILRRAVRYGYQSLQLKSSFLADLSVELGKQMGETFPELIAQKDIIKNVIREEENAFFHTLEQGIKRIELVMSQAIQTGSKQVSGAAAFELYDTFGFPIDLTVLIAKENGFTIDEKAFEQALLEQKERSRAAAAVSTDDWQILRDDKNEEFVGYDVLSTTVFITKYRKISQKNKTFYQLVFNVTPFYAEGGGQIGDRGFIEQNGEKTMIFDTKRENNLVVHLCEKLPDQLEQAFVAQVDVQRRKLTAANHSATHLMHHALRTVLGTHVEQKGSLVAPDYMRFDFSHFTKVNKEELDEVEKLVREAISKNIPLEEKRAVPIENAKKMGAMALFGEKYGDVVRVIKFGDSVELCGGTHVASTQDIGLFKIVSESSVAAGIRRVEVITNQAVVNYFVEKEAKLERIEQLLKHPVNVEKTIADLIEENARLKKSVELAEREQISTIKNELKSKISNLNGVRFLSAKLNLDAHLVKDILFQLKAELNEGFVAIIGASHEGKASLNVLITEGLVKEKGWHAGNLVREYSKYIQGGGGGQPFFATAGGKDVNGIDSALIAIQNALKEV